MYAQADFRKGVAWSVLATLFAAAFLVPYRFAIDGSSRTTAMTGMFAVAALFNGGIAIARLRQEPLRIDGVALRAAGALAICTLLGNFGIAAALVDIGAGMTSVVMKAQVILTPLLAIYLLSETAPSRLWLGAGLALAGLGLPQVLESSADGSWGYAVGFGGALSFSAMQIITRRVIHRIQAPLVNALRLAMAVGVLQLFPDGRAVWELSAEVWLYAGLTGILGPGLSRLCLMAAVRYVSPSLTALIALLGPVIAFGLGFVFFGETPTVYELAGAALILLGVVWPLLPSFSHRDGSSSV